MLKIERRSLSDVPTDKLLELILKYNSQVKEEIKEERLDREILEELTTLSGPLKMLKVA